MIQDISSYEDCREFISGFQGDPLFSDPMLSTQEMLDCNLIKAFTRPNRRILGVYDAQLAGLFVARAKQFDGPLADSGRKKLTLKRKCDILKIQNIR